VIASPGALEQAMKGPASKARGVDCIASGAM